VVHSSSGRCREAERNPGQLEQKSPDSIRKTKKAKRAWGVTQVVERLPRKHKALSSNCNNTGKKIELKRKKGKRGERK
jgi:hypothetical protein